MFSVASGISDPILDPLHPPNKAQSVPGEHPSGQTLGWYEAILKMMADGTIRAQSRFK